ncbi:acetyl-CoA acetyltransferase [Dactylosporangium matsuzakiense]|uniref:Acetyl-CoA acetyltransferase n=1 Tax=Dactylosporangium matsuzakiense TaxID=53360 RepID=A0A9W6KQB3_9ACTN|nr:acetyl-CoA acetyltransferase [Dactylosporangium matsuzakiense]UWZ47426.1 acetyl-CoA acetyltransferase [Dactylosporangium matsuzakiense]GLL05175.1 acetyl-CoA acetyltransferase [Dactylosporangium matsuzakiense]
MAAARTWVAGGFQTDFARNWARAGHGFAELFAEVTTGTLDAAGIDPADIGVIHVGNAFGQLFTGQGQLGGMPATVDERLWGIPATRHEAACASGGTAILAAMADLESGRYDAALVLGAELERTVPGDQAAGHLGAAAWVGHEGQQAKFMWPYMFSALADEYDKRYGLDEHHLRAIGRLNFDNARVNPNAQTRNWTFTDASFTDDDAANPPVEGRLRRNDCSQVTDGAAGVVLVGDRYLAAHPGLARRPLARILGWGHATVGLSLDQKLRRSADDPYVLPHVRRAVLDAFGRAGIGGVDDVDDVDGIETHDCFTMSQYAAIDHFGITAPGESWKAVESGELTIGGRIPMNPSGGLIGGGHPVGATGVRMLVDAYRQVTGQAGPYQVPGARTFATLNIGGSTTTTVSLVVGAAL